MAPFCKDENKYQVVNQIVKKIEEIKSKKIKIDNQNISEILTINGIRFTLEDGSWGLVRASSNKPSLVVVVESPSSEKRKKIFSILSIIFSKRQIKLVLTIKKFKN